MDKTLFMRQLIYEILKAGYAQHEKQTKPETEIQKTLGGIKNGNDATLCAGTSVQ